MNGDLNLDPAGARGADGTFGAMTSSGATSLPQVLDLTGANSLRDSLISLIASDAALLDAGAVERMSTPCAQVLLAAGRSATAAQVSFKIINGSVVFRTAIADLGLLPEFSKWMG